MNEQHQSYLKAVKIYETLTLILKKDGHVSYPIIINGNNTSNTPTVNITVVYYNEQLRPFLEQVIDTSESNIEVELKYRQKSP
ncbi:hypothetical protein OAE48_02195 [Flavobacteriales bacterium]|nr:hypothetical protein [Flavobacteriales bacterium]